MYNHINKGDKVSWNIGEQKVQGEVVDLYKNQMLRLQKDVNKYYHTRIHQAMLIALEDGSKVIKLDNEVRKVL